MDQPAEPALPGYAETAVIGAGFAGLATAIRLAQAGRDYAVLERAGDLGGTWRDNTYPGCACDVPSHLYSFSFAPNPDWSSSFSSQPEIHAYLRDTARRFGVLARTYFHAEVRRAHWDATAQLWRVQTPRGTLAARFLVVAVGPLSEPSRPDLPGLDRFRGTAFHSAAWRHDHDLAGARVAVIGTGASAIQFVPRVAPRARSLTLFQRTAPWVLPRRERAIRPAERAVYRHLPLAQRAARSAIYWGRESWLLGFAVYPGTMRLVERQALRYLARQVADPELRAKLTPRYRLGCKRVLLSNDYYPALTSPHVDVVTDRIVEVAEHGLISQDASGRRTEHPADTIIFGTGFHVTDPPIAERLCGRDGRTLAEHWRNGMAALYGLTVAGFPNMFFLIGPNTGLGHSSIVFMIEAQVGYLLDAMARLAASSLAVLEPRPAVQDAYNGELQARLARTVWNTGGCASYYLDSRGRNTTLWPTFTFRYRHRMRQVRLEDYLTQPAWWTPGSAC